MGHLGFVQIPKFRVGEGKRGCWRIKGLSSGANRDNRTEYSSDTNERPGGGGKKTCCTQNHMCVKGKKRQDRKGKKKARKVKISGYHTYRSASIFPKPQIRRKERLLG